MNLTSLIGPIANIDPQPVQSRKAILWGRDDLLAQVIGSFLKNTEWDVIRISSDGDVENLIREMKRVKPEVVILCRYKTDDSALALRLIEEQTCLKVITLGPDSNHTQVYSKQNIILGGSADLLSIIEKGNFSDYTPGKEAQPTEQNR
ncbi:MAG: hypothetical protein ACM3XO_22250 [Bacteroidota bacterium]